MNTVSQSVLENFRTLLAMAKAEDFGRGDVTSDLLPAAARATANFVARQELVLCGGAFLAEIAAAYDAGIATSVLMSDGHKAARGAVLATWTGSARAMFAAERVALNFLQRLSGVATATRRYVDAVAGTGAAIYDTRKTIPGWRELEKYAVRTGGGCNHRRGLYDAVLVKDNHLAALIAGGEGLAALGERLDAARARLGVEIGDTHNGVVRGTGGGFVEVEVDSLGQLEQALRLPVDIILLDNFTIEQMARAVAMRDKAALKGKIALEASGGITLQSVADVARSGVERIAVGAITHSAPAVDIGLDIAC
ncbi:MAG: nicotinate-nucleotide diphosphorylase [Planctomycetaceae bacterium]|nr:nicotinate-nucleotide diphosphorylase [Planctomycetaceae bacterium]